MKKEDCLRGVNIMNDEKHCQGCGILLQDQNVLQEGYTTSLDNDLCQRCFRMRNYGEYQVVVKSNEEYLKILETVSKTNDLVVYVTDLLNLEKNIEEIRNMMSNKMILVLNKIDVLPKSVKETKLIGTPVIALQKPGLNKNIKALHIRCLLQNIYKNYKGVIKNGVLYAGKNGNSFRKYFRIYKNS